MDHLVLKLIVVAIVACLAVMVARDFYMGRAPAVRDGFAVRYARRADTPMLFWLFTIGRAAVIALIAIALLRP